MGSSQARFLLAATIRKHLSQKEQPLTDKIASYLYVDNLVTGVQSPQEAEELFITCRENFKELSMNIREWNSNNQEFIQSIPTELTKPQRTISVLGFQWNTWQDTLKLQIKPEVI